MTFKIVEKMKWYFESLIRNFTVKLMIFIALENFFIKGLASQAIDLVMLRFFTNTLGVGVLEYAKYFTVEQMGWSLKPLLAALSDMVPVRGYRKRYYVVLYALLGTTCLLIANHLPHHSSYGAVAAFVFFLAAGCVAGIGVLVEGQYSQIMALNPKEGPNIVSWAWSWYTIGGITGVTLEGTVAHEADVIVVMWAVAPMFLIVVIPALLGWIPEGKTKSACAGGLLDDGAIPTSILPTTAVLAPGNRRSRSSTAAARVRIAATTDVDNAADVSLAFDEATHRNGAETRASVATEPSSPRTHSDQTDQRHNDEDDADNEGPSSSSDVSTIAATGASWKNSVQGLTLSLAVNDEDASHWSHSVKYKKATLTIGTILGIGVVAVAALTLTESGNGWAIMACNFFFALCLLAAMRHFLPRLVFAVGAFAFFKDVFYLHTFAILDRWMTATPDCVADAPHFDYRFYQFYVNVVGNTCSWIAIVIFQKFFLNLKFHHAAWITTTIKCLSSFVDFSIVMRWNVAIGIPDTWAFMLGTGVVFHIMSWLDFNVLLILLSKACPKRVETTTFALLTGMLTLAESVSEAMAYKMAGALGIASANGHHHHTAPAPPTNWTESGSMSSWTNSSASAVLSSGSAGGSSGVGSESATAALCNYDNLPILLGLGHFVFPLLIYPMAYLVLPHRKMTDHIDVFHPNEDDYDAVEREDQRRRRQGGVAPLNTTDSLDNSLQQALIAPE